MQNKLKRKNLEIYKSEVVKIATGYVFAFSNGPFSEQIPLLGSRIRDKTFRWIGKSDKRDRRDIWLV